MSYKFSDEQVDRLIRVADAGEKPRQGYWWTLWIPVTRHYRLGDQLDAIRQLGESENERALAYLDRLAAADDRTLGQYEVDGNYFEDKEFSHPNARGDLDGALRSRLCDCFNRTEFNNEHAVRVLYEALDKIKQSLGKSSE